MTKPIEYGNKPTLASLLEAHQKNTMASINCHQVGEIVSFDPSTQTAEVQIKMTRIVNDQILSYPLLVDCPCVVLGGGQGRVTFPIKQGDSCLVLFNDRDIDNWYSGGQTMPPRTPRNHSFSDAIALVGIRNMQNKITDYLADGTELKYGNASIKLQNGTITVNAPFVNINGNVNVVQNEVDDNSLHAYIISSYHSGTDWYRVYSDGWCEQGGRFESADGSDTTVNFLKPFIDTNYTPIVGQQYGSDGLGQFRTFNIYTLLPGSMVIHNTTNGTNICIWEAKGYIK